MTYYFTFFIFLTTKYSNQTNKRPRSTKINNDNSEFNEHIAHSIYIAHSENDGSRESDFFQWATDLTLYELRRHFCNKHYSTSSFLTKDRDPILLGINILSILKITKPVLYVNKITVSSKDAHDDQIKTETWKEKNLQSE